MGCSNSNDRNKVQKDNEFYKEAMAFKKADIKGLHVDKDYSKTKTTKYPEGVNPSGGECSFMEEIIDHATESGAVKPWLTNIVCPDQNIEEIRDAPKYTLKIDHIFGFRVENTRQNLFFLSSDQLLYVTSSLGIIQNIDDYSQVLFGGFQSKEGHECHDNDIMSLAFYEGDVSMVATGQRGMKPKILVWSPLDTSVVYAKFQQPKGSKEVSGLAFDRNGHYLASFGKDPVNSFYVFDMRTKKLFWEQPTDDSKTKKNINKGNDFILDVEFHPKKDEICFVGVNKIIFAILLGKHWKNVHQETEDGTFIIYTCVIYLPNGQCLIGSDQGEVLIYKDNKFDTTTTVSKKMASIQNLAHSEIFHKIYVSDSLGYVYILNDDDFSREDKFKMPSICRSLDVNADEDIVMGLSSGEIVIKHYKEKSKSEEIILQCHSTGSICGLDFIPDNRIVTTGEDNKIIVWNLRSKKSEHVGMINEIEVNPNATSDNDLYELQPRNKSNCVSYNTSRGHIAVGINDGTVSIRKDMKKLDEKLFPEDLIIVQKDPNIQDTSIYEITEVKYTNYGDMLAIAVKTGHIVVLDCNNRYETKYLLKPMDSSYIVTFDWDMTNKYIQAITKNNQYIFINVDKKCVVKDPYEMKGVDWPKITCKFGYTVQGVYLGSTDPDFISCVCKANSKKMILTGDDDCLLNLFNYPTIDETHKYKSFRGHSGHIKKIIFTKDDEKVITIAEEDKAIILWDLIPG